MVNHRWGHKTYPWCDLIRNFRFIIMGLSKLQTLDLTMGFQSLRFWLDFSFLLHNAKLLEDSLSHWLWALSVGPIKCNWICEIQWAVCNILNPPKGILGVTVFGLLNSLSVSHELVIKQFLGKLKKKILTFSFFIF